MREYTMVLHPEPEDGGYSGTVPALPGCVTEGETVEECIANAREAINGYIESLAVRYKSAPEGESAGRPSPSVSLPEGGSPSSVAIANEL
jgi:antitoxin HicB